MSIKRETALKILYNPNDLLFQINKTRNGEFCVLIFVKNSTSQTPLIESTSPIQTRSEAIGIIRKLLHWINELKQELSERRSFSKLHTLEETEIVNILNKLCYEDSVGTSIN